jgi:ADP-L-glycero-D-manno-heptose 6-epimerase
MAGRRLILVTGGAGFIGSNIVAQLAESADVVVCDRLGRDDRWRNIAKHDVADLVSPQEFLDYLVANRRAVDVVIHMGAISSTTEIDVGQYVRNNFDFSRDLWRVASEHGVRLIYASSAATYGSGEDGFRDDERPEALARLRPLNAYGWSKHLFDRFVVRSVTRGVAPPQWAGLKFFNVYGPNEQHKGSMKSVVAEIYSKTARGEVARLFRSHDARYEDGGQLRDFIYVDDCVRVVDWLVRNSSVSGLFNVGTGKARSFADLAAAVFAAIDREPQIEFIDTPIEIREKYQYFTQADTDKLRGAGFSAPFTELEAGVSDYVQRFLATPDPYR